MLLKLLVARRVHTPFYVTLDSDVFLKRGTNYTDLVHQGRALYQGRLFQRAEGVGGGHRRQWWSAANDLLQANKCVSRRAPMSSNWVIGVTPAVVSANVQRPNNKDVRFNNSPTFEYVPNVPNALPPPPPPRTHYL